MFFATLRWVVDTCRANWERTRIEASFSALALGTFLSCNNFFMPPHSHPTENVCYPDLCCHRKGSREVDKMLRNLLPSDVRWGEARNSLRLDSFAPVASQWHLESSVPKRKCKSRKFEATRKLKIQASGNFEREIRRGRKFWRNFNEIFLKVFGWNFRKFSSNLKLKFF